MKLGPGTFFRSVTEKELTDCTLLQIHNAPELAAFCEGFFLKHMSSLLEQDSFRQLIYSRNSKVQGLDPLRDLQTALAGRLHSVYVTSRVWSRNKAVAEALVQTAQGHGLKQSWGFPVCLLESSVLAGSPLQQKPHQRGGCLVPLKEGSWLLCATTVRATLCEQCDREPGMQAKNPNWRDQCCHSNKVQCRPVEKWGNLPRSNT